MFIFSQLPNDIIKYIITFDKRFKIRKGELVSIILQDDYRYKLLEYITIKPANSLRNDYNYLCSDSISYNRYDYILPNLYNIKERNQQLIGNDSIQIIIDFKKNGTINYNVFIYRLKLKDKSIFRKKLFYKGNLDDYEWNFIMYNYKRS